MHFTISEPELKVSEITVQKHTQITTYRACWHVGIIDTGDSRSRFRKAASIRPRTQGGDMKSEPDSGLNKKAKFSLFCLLLGFVLSFVVHWFIGALLIVLSIIALIASQIE